MRVVIVGGGIAGVSAAYELAAHHEVVVVEQETQLAIHTTGRSAALFTENYGDGATRPLTAASRQFFDEPPPGFADHSLLSTRGALTIARRDQLDAAHGLYAAGAARSSAVDLIDGDAARVMCPALRPDVVVAAVWDPEASDIDVAALHQGYVRGLRARGGRVLSATPLVRARHSTAGWTVDTPSGSLNADIIVDAAGAWGDVVAERCGIAPLGLDPRRRTAFMVAAPPGATGWPMIIDADEAFYFKPDGTQLLCSPADETPSPPVDARPAEVDVALAIDRISAATTLELRHVRSQWAGLRTFTPDRVIAIGRDTAVPSFVWCVGQGGTGIQSAPAAARLTAAVVGDGDVPPDLTNAGLVPSDVDPGRFRTSPR